MNFTKTLLTRCSIVPSFFRTAQRSISVANKCICTSPPLATASSPFSEILRRWKSTTVVHVHAEKVNTLAVKKRPVRKRRVDESEAGYFCVSAFATAEEYNLERLLIAIKEQNLYEPQKFFPEDSYEEEPDVLHVKAKYEVETEPRDIYFFREGTVVLWNCTDLECSNVLAFLHNFEEDRYEENIVHEEMESMLYSYSTSEGDAYLKNNRFYLSHKEKVETTLEKYTYSNAITASVKLGIWESSLDKYVDSMEFVTNDLKRGSKIRISRPEMLRKTGELFALRHLINLSSDLLDTPDFYWDRDRLETLYSQTCNYFSIPRRTRVMNEKINHCIELADLISSNLNDDHHVRLEWMIIILIMVEVGFELIHFADRYLL